MIIINKIIFFIKRNIVCCDSIKQVIIIKYYINEIITVII